MYDYIMWWIHILTLNHSPHFSDTHLHEWTWYKADPQVWYMSFLFYWFLMLLSPIMSSIIFLPINYSIRRTNKQISISAREHNNANLRDLNTSVFIEKIIDHWELLTERRELKEWGESSRRRRWLNILVADSSMNQSG